jgi:hypothetical protein
MLRAPPLHAERILCRRQAASGKRQTAGGKLQAAGGKRQAASRRRQAGSPRHAARSTQRATRRTRQAACSQQHARGERNATCSAPCAVVSANRSCYLAGGRCTVLWCLPVAAVQLTFWPCSGFGHAPRGRCESSPCSTRPLRLSGELRCHKRNKITEGVFYQSYLVSSTLNSTHRISRL